jgi:hypothetical protein
MTLLLRASSSTARASALAVLRVKKFLRQQVLRDATSAHPNGEETMARPDLNATT